MTTAQPSPEAVRNAGRVLAEARAIRDSLSPREAAEQAYEPGGRSVDELEDVIREMRGLPKLERRQAS